MDFWVIPPFIHAFSEFRCHEKCLNRTVHVASGTLIAQPEVLTLSFASLQILYLLPHLLDIFLGPTDPGGGPRSPGASSTDLHGFGLICIVENNCHIGLNLLFSLNINYNVIQRDIKN